MHQTVALKGCEIAINSSGEGLPIIVIAGGPGLSSDYLSPLLTLNDRYRVVFFDQPGCGKSISSVTPTAALTVEATVRIIRLFAPNGSFVLLAHSWGALLAVRACSELRTPPAQTILLNPVPFSRHGFDTIGGRLVGRVNPDVMARIAALSDQGTREAGRELMRLALPAYCGRAANLPNVSFDFDIATSNSVTASLGDYDLHPTTLQMGPQTLLFGATDYILPSDFDGELPEADRQLLDTGHFSMLDAPHEVSSIVRKAIES